MKKKTTLHDKALEVLLAKEFKRCRLDCIKFDFAGSGDSGGIEGWTFEPDGGDPDESVTHGREALVSQFDLENKVYAALERTGLDYANNEGGQGTVTVRPSGFEISFGVNVMTTELHQFSYPLEAE